MDVLTTDSPSKAEVPRAIAVAIRFGLAAVVLCISVGSFLGAQHAGKFREIYQDMLPGLPLPAATAFVLQHPGFLAALSILFPLRASVGVYTPGGVKSLYLSSGLIVCAFIQLAFELFALLSPLMTMVTSMQPSPP